MAWVCRRCTKSFRRDNGKVPQRRRMQWAAAGNRVFMPAALPAERITENGTSVSNHHYGHLPRLTASIIAAPLCS